MALVFSFFLPRLSVFVHLWLSFLSFQLLRFVCLFILFLRFHHDLYLNKSGYASRSGFSLCRQWQAVSNPLNPGWHFWPWRLAFQEEPKHSWGSNELSLSKREDPVAYCVFEGCFFLSTAYRKGLSYKIATYFWTRCGIRWVLSILRGINIIWLSLPRCKSDQEKTGGGKEWGMINETVIQCLSNPSIESVTVCQTRSIEQFTGEPDISSVERCRIFISTIHDEYFVLHILLSESWFSLAF